MPNIVIATSTFYKTRSDLRFELACKTMQWARAVGNIPVVIVDGSPRESGVFEALQTAGGCVFPEMAGSTMGAGRRQSLREAASLAGHDGVVVWMEPEKGPLAEFLRQLAEPIFNDHADIVIPARTPDGFASYPLVQNKYEDAGNASFELLTGKDLDVWFGPRLMNAKGLQHFLDYDGNRGDRWEAIFIPLLRAIKAGLRVESISADYWHPEEQTAAEEKDLHLGLTKRLEQLTVLVNAMAAEAKDLQIGPFAPAAS